MLLRGLRSHWRPSYWLLAAGIVGTAPAQGGQGARAGFDLEARRAHWCWQLPADAPPPDVVATTWPRDPLDHFVLARMEARDLAPAGDAAPALWLRRVSFDLTGLPPGPDVVRRFEAQPDAAARARVVDELLASPHFGERWARHWLDLVRYAETLGHEQDFEIPGAWRYRDYVVRAFNQDLPYDRFVQEHLAGDILPEPRRHASGFDESVIGTSFFWFGDQVHSPVDVRRHTADRIDNQIDVLTKTFLGVTVSCARCHDHKFDAIPQTDYYALYGVLHSSRYALTPLGPADGFATTRAALRAARPTLKARIGARWAAVAADLEHDLRAVVTAPPRPRRADKEEDKAFEARRHQFDADLAAHATAHGRDVGRVRAWLDALASNRVARDRSHPLHALGLAVTEPERFAERWRKLTEPTAARPSDAATRVLADARAGDMAKWFAVGDAFVTAAEPTADVLTVEANARPFVRLLPGAWTSSGTESLRLQGELSSPTFTIDRRYLWILAAGHKTRFNVVVEGFNLIRNPIYGGLRVYVDADRPRWYRVDLAMWPGREAYLQLVDVRTADPCDGDGRYDAPGFLAVQQVQLSDSDRAPDAGMVAPSVDLIGASPAPSGEDLAIRYATAIRASVVDWQRAPDSRSLRGVQAELLSSLSLHRLLDGAPKDPDPEEGAQEGPGDDVLARVAELETAIVEVPCVPAMGEGDGRDAPVFRRGDPANPAAPEPRHGLTALASDASAYRTGSGRLALAREITRDDHPLTARVFVNRAWHHLFGAGLAPTVDNLGALGVEPSHPALLDHLTRAFVAEGWSLKRLLRRIALSRTYGMASAHADPRAAVVDADLRLQHRARVRRLDGEALRDAMLVLAGRLDPTLEGASVPVHLTPFLDGRGRPDRQGPVDGAGRRSVYQEVRRNFLSPMFLAFDTPIPFTTVGQRSVSNVPAQALTLMNDAFVAEMARAWATRALADDPVAGPEARAASMLRALYSRAPTPAEIGAAVAFVHGSADPKCPALESWTDLAHALLGVKEFVFLR